jgi:transcriptional regulator with XRE-family HTH domain
MNAEQKTFGAWLKEKRNLFRLSQDAFAEAVRKHLKEGRFTKSYVSLLENDRPQGKSGAPPSPRKEILQAIAKVYGVTDDEVLTVSGWNLTVTKEVAGQVGNEPIEVLAMGIAEQAKMYSPERQEVIRAMLEGVKKTADQLGENK